MTWLVALLVALAPGLALAQPAMPPAAGLPPAGQGGGPIPGPAHVLTNPVDRDLGIPTQIEPAQPGSRAGAGQVPARPADAPTPPPRPRP